MNIQAFVLWNKWNKQTEQEEIGIAIIYLIEDIAAGTPIFSLN